MRLVKSDDKLIVEFNTLLKALGKVGKWQLMENCGTGKFRIEDNNGDYPLGENYLCYDEMRRAIRNLDRRNLVKAFKQFKAISNIRDLMLHQNGEVASQWRIANSDGRFVFGSDYHSSHKLAQMLYFACDGVSLYQLAEGDRK